MTAEAATDVPASGGGTRTPSGDTRQDRPRQPRADARRNRRRILAAAEETFAREGLTAPIDAVARRAGVGIGTLYRHFPTKESLLEAIVLDRIDEMVSTWGEVPGPGGSPVDAFFAFLRQLADEVTAKHDLMDALGDAGAEFKSRCATQFDRLHELVEALRQRAADAGGIRPDVTATQVVALVVGTCKVADPGAEDSAACRMLDVVFDGLRTGA